MPRSTDEIENFFRTVLSIPAHRTFGLSLIDWEPGKARLEFVAEAASLGPSGEVHGGVTGLLLEPAALFALLPMLSDDRYAVTVDIHTQLLRRIRSQARVILEGRVMRLGTQLAFCEAIAVCDDQICVSARITKAIVASPSEPRAALG